MSAPEVKYNHVQITATEKKYVFLEGAKVFFKEGPLNIFMLCTPFACISYFAKWPEPVTFTLSLLAIAPFAERLGYVTEQLALHTNDTIGGLLNATFGNATELIIAISALNQGLYRVIQLSLLGSILSNMLLVLGTAFLFGGLKHKTQTFGTISGQINSSLLMLSCMGLLFPSILTNASEESAFDELTLSRISALILLFLYGCFLYFQLSTHRDAYEPEAEVSGGSVAPVPSTGPAQIERTHSTDLFRPAGLRSTLSGNCPPSDRMNERLIGEHDKSDVEGKEADGASNEEEDEVDEDIMGYNYAIVWLLIITVFIAFLSNAMVESIEATSKHVSGFFLSAIVMPIVGNAAEHASAIIFAMKNKLDLSMGVAIGSSTQIALMVLPTMVILGWVMDRPMSLNFHQFETATLLTTVIIVTFAIKNGNSNWLLGAILVGAYAIISAGFLVHNNESLDVR